MGDFDELDDLLNDLDNVKFVDREPHSKKKEENEEGSKKPDFIFASFDSDEDESYVVKGDIKKFSEFIEKNVKENKENTKKKFSVLGAVNGLFSTATGLVFNTVIVIAIIIFLIFGAKLLTYMVNSMVSVPIDTDNIQMPGNVDFFYYD